MSISGGPVLPDPVTPSKKKQDEPLIFLQDLNETYNLGIPAYEKITPLSRRQLGDRDVRYRRHSDIKAAVQYIWHKRKQHLDDLLRDFDVEARPICRNWVPKPHGDTDVLPISPDCPRASDHKQQENLQKTLLQLLEKYKSTIIQSTKSTTDALQPSTTSEPAVHTHQPRRGKRRSEDGTPRDEFSKRIKAVEPDNPFAPIDVNVSTDRVVIRRKLDAPNLLDQRRRSTRISDLASGNSSRASLHSRIFSETNDDHVLPDTQTTNPVSTQEDKRNLQHIDPGQAFHIPFDSQGSYTASPATRQAFESFNTPESARVLDHQPSSTVRSNYSSLPELADLTDPGWDTPMIDAGADLESLIPPKLASRLKDVWPSCPAWLLVAPFPAIWEVTRIAVHCGVDLATLSSPLTCDHWDDQLELRKTMRKHEAFTGATFPPSSDTTAWDAAVGRSQSSHETAVYVVSMEFTKGKEGPLYKLKFQEIKLELPYRLSRHFGPSRFLEILLPSYNNDLGELKDVLKDESNTKALVKWLTRSQHPLVGRKWRAFFMKDGGYKKPAVDYRLGPEPKPVWKDRIYLFAEEELGSPRAPAITVDPVTVEDMLKWLLQFDREGSSRQHFLKLFSRTALGLSRTTPTVVFDPHQIRRKEQDLLSPEGKVMNDGIARMSLSVARQIRDTLGLIDIPSAIQGRLGSAKGVWVIDTTDSGHADWIEMYPSQVKWDSDFSHVHHRTLEVRSHAKEVRSTGLNLQLLPVLEDRAKDKRLLRSVITRLLEANLNREFEGQKLAIQGHPLQFRQWIQEHSSSTRPERVLYSGIPFTGGLPSRDEETMAFLLDAGFDPKTQKFVQNLAWDLRRLQCEQMKDKMRISVPRSAYILMVVDFLGVLEEDEVHVCFSSKFRDEISGFSDFCLDGMDVLVTRSPAHFPSDIQRVEAVFKRELRALQDVIVFSSKGSGPLADKLSGGDYDGDIAWVCWDPDLVENFQNADVPAKPDLKRFLHKRTTTMKELQVSHGANAVAEMLEQSFEFNMRENFLGRCTNYKERMTYKNKTISNSAALVLSELVSNLVDQAKQGIEFDTKNWKDLLLYIGEPQHLKEPLYKARDGAPGKYTHIIDHLKFNVVKPAIDRELAAFDKAMNPSKLRSPSKASPSKASPSKASPSKASPDDMQEAHYWDQDLVKHAKFFGVFANKSKSTTRLRDDLVKDIHRNKALWDKLTATRDEGTYPQKIQQVYDDWCAIFPRTESSTALATSKMIAVMFPPHLKDLVVSGVGYDSWGPYQKDAERCEWALYRASLTFSLYHTKSPKYTWVVAGRQLARIKAMSQPGLPITIAGPMYAALKLDTKTAKQMVARLEGQGTQYHPDDLGDDESGYFDDDA